MSRQRGRVPEAARMLTLRGQIPAPIAFLPVPVVPKRVAAAYLGISVKTLEAWIADGTGPASVQYTRGGNLYFRIQALDAFIAAHERVGGDGITHSEENELEGRDAVASH